MGLETKLQADFNLTLDFHAIKTRKLSVEWLSMDMKRENTGLKGSHAFIYIPTTHTPSGAFPGAAGSALKVGVQQHRSIGVLEPITHGPRFPLALKALET